MLTSARDYYRAQQRLTALALRAARRNSGRATTVVATYQATAAVVSDEFAARMLEEQGIASEALGRLSHAAFVSAAAADMLARVDSALAFDRLVGTLVQDAGRSAMSVATAIRPAVGGHVRYLNLPSCGRCAVLAGRVYRWSDGFQRHPLCDCQMVPTTQERATELVPDPMVAFERGQIRGLSQDDTRAIRDGADLGQVVNVRRRKAGLTDGGRVLTRAGRPTPAGIYRAANGDRDVAVDLLRRHGYIT